MWRKIGGGIVILLILAVGSGYYYAANLAASIEASLESDGSAATQTAVRAGGVRLSLLPGYGSISSLRVANPPGYSTRTALALDSVDIQLDIFTLPGNGTVIAKHVNIVRPHIAYEVKLPGLQSNLQVIQSNIAAYSGGASAPGGLGARKEIIRDLTITGGKVTVIAPVLSGKILVVDLPPLHFTDLGGSTGATPAQLAAQVVNVMTRQAIITGAAAIAKQGISIPAEAEGVLKSLLGN
jgi:hypothetical protein